jgi:hypothetical protein
MWQEEAVGRSAEGVAQEYKDAAAEGSGVLSLPALLVQKYKY